MFTHCQNHAVKAALAIILPLALPSSITHAEFALNFSGTTSTTISVGGSSVGGQSPFTGVGPNEASGDYFIDPSNGLGYWHYLLGDPASGFAQEVYIRASSSSCGQGTICSSSGGTTGFGSNNLLGANNTTSSGNGTANPNNVIMRQVLDGTWDGSTSTWTCDTAYCSEFIKDTYANKPKITQEMNDTSFATQFILDMSAISLSDDTTSLTVTNGSTGATGASLTNMQTVYDSTSSSVFSFDMALDGEVTYVNGGQYKYTTGTGRLGASGTYTYVDGSFNPMTIDYSPFLDDSVSNPWTYPANKP